jgi:hypothetical protein
MLLPVGRNEGVVVDRRMFVRRDRRRYDGREQRAALREWPSFAACSGKELALVDSSTYEARIEPGVVLAREQTFPGQITFVLEGWALETAGGAAVALAGPGSCVAGIAAVARTVQPTTVRAQTSMLVRVATAPEYRTLIARVDKLHPRIQALPRIDDVVDRGIDELTTDTVMGR